MKPSLFNALVVIALVGCESASSDPVGDGSARTATIQGSAQRAGAEASATQITVFRVAADGSLEPDARGSTSCDEDGRYSVEVGVIGEGESNLIVQAQYDDGSTASLVLNGQISGSTTRVAPPMGEETTAEADLFLGMVAEGAVSSDGEEAALIRAFVDASVAAAYHEADEAERGVVASATAAAIASWTASSEAASEAALGAYLSGMIQADAAADDEAEAGGSGSVDAWAELEAAWSASGFSEIDLAFAIAAAAEAHGHMAEGEDGEAIGASSAFLAQLRAELMAEVVGGAWAELGEGAEEAEEAEEEAADALLAELSAVVETSADAADESYDEAMDGYALAVLAELEATLSVEGALACEQAIDVAASAQVELSASVAAASASDAGSCGESVSEAMDAYRARIDAEVTAALEASGALDESQVHALATIIGQLHAHAE